MAAEGRSPRVTRCPDQSRDSPFAAAHSLPSGTSRSLGIQALNTAPTDEACPNGSPDLPSLPAIAETITRLDALRITAPDPLLPARLAVLRTSWNRVHHAPNQRAPSRLKRRLSSGNIFREIWKLGPSCRGRTVDKTKSRANVRIRPDVLWQHRFAPGKISGSQTPQYGLHWIYT
jgi:hypothetical protein